MLETITIAIMVLGILAALFSGFMLIRNHFVYENHMKIINAIHEYNQEQILHNHYDLKLDYNTNMESYSRTMWRLWDFGCKRIVTPDIYKKIEPYL